jgi:nitrilase
LVDPWGGLLAERAEGAGVVCAELDFDRLSACRAQLPALGDRVL